MLPSHRQRGIAKAMMRAIADRGTGLGVDHWRVEVRRSLPSNVALYESLGHAVVAEYAHPRDPLSCLVMAPRLPATAGDATGAQQAGQPIPSR